MKNKLKLKPINKVKQMSYGYYDNMIPKGCVTIIAGQPGSGKSTLMCYLAKNISYCAKTAIITNEEDAGIIAGRAMTDSNVQIASFSDNPGHVKITSEEIIETLNDFDVIFVDSLITLNAGKDINKAGTAESFLTPFISKVANTNKALIFLHHTNKGGGDSLQDIISGSNRLVSGVRHCKIVINDELHNRRFLAVVKDNTNIQERNLEIISQEIWWENGHSTWIVKNLVPTTIDIEKVLYENSTIAKRKRWDKEISENLYRTKNYIEIPPKAIQNLLCKFVDEFKRSDISNNEYIYISSIIRRTNNKWLIKNRKGKNITYKFSDLALEWRDSQNNYFC